jgi:hypothetical protein
VCSVLAFLLWIYNGNFFTQVFATKLKATPEVEEEEILIPEEPEADKSPEEISAFMADVANLVK